MGVLQYYLDGDDVDNGDDGSFLLTWYPIGALGGECKVLLKM